MIGGASASSAPDLAIVVVIYNMQREAPRTLYSLSVDYQLHVSSDDYQVIVVENGSSQPLQEDCVNEFGSNFRYVRIENASPSPAGAINYGASLSNAPHIGIMIDGARLASPGVVALAIRALRSCQRAVVGTLGFHLGPDMQTRSPQEGYSRAVEDQLLRSIDWRSNGYKLFQISVPGGSSKRGWLAPLAESNFVFMPRTMFEELNGYDEKFDFPGGGLVNLDFFRRACDLPNSTVLTLYGEGTFHQFHGGDMANRPHEEVRRRFETYNRQYEEIRGERFFVSTRQPLLLGDSRPQFRAGFENACRMVVGRGEDPELR